MNDTQRELFDTRPKRKLRNYFIIGTVIVMAFIIIVTVVLEWLASYLGWFGDEQVFQYVAIGLTSVITGIALFYFTSSIILRPINDILDGMSKLSDGKYDARLNYSDGSIVEPIYKSFNTLAQELQNVEIIQSDFVNNFSHELKTPLMSINGLIGLMKNNDLPKEKQVEYLNIIEEETDRLTLLTTNILNLTKLENQGILADKHCYNVSEQIRMCVLLLERQWTTKRLNLTMGFDEFFIEANEDMLKQVWLNLLDNAVKFADEGGALCVGIEKGEDATLSVKISNSGLKISESDSEKIFNKFYQADKSHSRSGNGIGLSIVKRIVDLHKGTVSVAREDDMTVFTVALPTK
ncbi:MAG: HAMP domain-containing histidine kinase [Clostridiales bacterium]|nr:HAMP domain-containing histidine kinase [Clostridiales bacterium]